MFVCEFLFVCACLFGCVCVLTCVCMRVSLALSLCLSLSLSLSLFVCVFVCYKGGREGVSVTCSAGLPRPGDGHPARADVRGCRARGGAGAIFQSANYTTVCEVGACVLRGVARTVPPPWAI